MLRLDDWPDDYRDQFWYTYPRRIAKKTAMKALDKVKRDGQVPWVKFIQSVDRYCKWLKEPGWHPDPKHPATWLNGGCWDDELVSSTPRATSTNGFAAVSRRMMEEDRR